VLGDIAETPDLQGAFPRLSDAQIAALAGQGDRRGTRAGEILFREGERDCGFYVVLAGHVASVEAHGTCEERVISVHGRGQFLGELSLLTGEGSFCTALSLDAGEVVREHDLGERMLRYLIDQVMRLPNVHVMVDAEVRELHGGQALEAITVADRRTGTARPRGARTLRLHGGGAVHRLAGRTGALAAGDQQTRRLRRRRCPQRLGQASRRGSRRGGDGNPARLRKNPASVGHRGRKAFTDKFPRCPLCEEAMPCR
jgi:CRP-like cAMP-binding protein